MTTATAVRERPILFSGPMVSAILDGRKTQTRRVVDWREDTTHPAFRSPASYFAYSGQARDGRMQFTAYSASYVSVPGDDRGCAEILCHYGQPGDLLWVRETWRVGSRDRNTIWYRADDGVLVLPDSAENLSGKFLGDRWRPSIHMPKWAARIWLRVTDVRVERLQEITEEDARAEGFTDTETVDHSTDGKPFGEGFTMGPMTEWTSAAGNFARLWDTLNAARGYGWDTNPWVWRIAFERTEAPS